MKAEMFPSAVDVRSLPIRNFPRNFEAFTLKSSKLIITNFEHPNTHSAVGRQISAVSTLRLLSLQNPSLNIQTGNHHGITTC